MLCGLGKYQVAKTSAGALERMPAARVTNISRNHRRAQTQVWVAGIWMENHISETEGVMKGAIALRIEMNEKGIGRLVKEKCDSR